MGDMMQDYQKRLKKYYKMKERQSRIPKKSYEKEEKTKNTYFDKLFIRIFLSALALFAIIGIDKYFIRGDNLKQEVSSQMNILKFASFFNGIFGEGLFIPSPSEIPVISSSIFEAVKYENGVNFITSDSFEGVTNVMPGVVVKIIKQNGLYEITIKGIDDREYRYGNLESIDYNIYSYVAEGAILGKSKFELGKYQFTLTIKEKNKLLNFYDLCEN